MTARLAAAQRDAYLLRVLADMPNCCELRRLDVWDDAYKQMAPDDRSSTETLIEALYWLGAGCLYGAYTEETIRNYYYQQLMPSLSQAGIEVPMSPDLSAY